MDKEKEKEIVAPELYKGFDLDEFVDGDKAQAIIDFLDLDGDVDELSEDDNSYTVNHRKVKRGTSPKKYIEVITAFKELLTPKQREMINSYLKLLSVLEYCECGKVKDKLYHKISSALEKLSESKDEKVKALLEVCNKDNYPINILYHLLWLPDNTPKTSYHTPVTEAPDYVLSYREAWFGQKVIDRREFSSDDDGEYMVLTDSEADDMCDDYLDEDQWRMAVEAKNTWSGYREWCQEVIDIDGRGHILNSNDGSEDEQNGYYIYRIN